MPLTTLPEKNSPLPMTQSELAERGWEQIDVLLITGDAYIDHPAQHVAMIGRVLESKGYRVGIAAQPNWQDLADFTILGIPRLCVFITAGNNEPLGTYFTIEKRRLMADELSPGGKNVGRLERATITYAHRARQAFPKTPIIIGGIEASLRRLAYFDPWEQKVRRSILIDSKADLLIYSIGDVQLAEIVARLDRKEKIDAIQDLRGTVIKVKNPPNTPSVLEIFSYEEVRDNKLRFAQAFADAYLQQDPLTAPKLVQKTGDWYVLINQPPLPLNSEQMDAIYSLPFSREVHPLYKDRDRIPAAEQWRFSIVSHRGCACQTSFCYCAYYHGSVIQSRSEESILAEAAALVSDPSFQGVITDVGGTYANEYGTDLRPISTLGGAESPAQDYLIQTDNEELVESGLPLEATGETGGLPEPEVAVRTLDVNGGLQTEASKTTTALKRPATDLSSQKRYTNLLQKLSKVAGVKRVLVSSPIRFETAIKERELLKQLVNHHLQDFCRVIPGHVSRPLLEIMRAPRLSQFERFLGYFQDYCQKAKKTDLWVSAHFISGHPGCRLSDMVELASFGKRRRLRLDGTTNFVPVPFTISACMYYTGIDPFTLTPVYVPASGKERKLQRALTRYNDSGYYHLVKKALLQTRRTDLIGRNFNCLIDQHPRPRVMRKSPFLHTPAPSVPRAPGQSRLNPFRHRAF